MIIVIKAKPLGALIGKIIFDTSVYRINITEEAIVNNENILKYLIGLSIVDIVAFIAWVYK